jgi:SH3-like domain-containing protein
MKAFILILSVLVLSINTYDRSAAKAYAERYWDSLNHDCDSSYYSCTPYSYWGGEHCGYESQGGDCANFVSQCLLAGGHPHLVGGECRGYPCGVEEIGAWNLGACLRETFGWKRVCGYLQSPPSGVQAGDVIIYHAGSCDSGTAHAVIVIEGGSNPKIACHSSMRYGASYDYLSGSKPYFEWLLYPGGSPEPEPDPEPSSEAVKLVKVIGDEGVNIRTGPSLDDDVIGNYPTGTIVQVVEKTGTWYKTADGQYISAKPEYVKDLVGTVTADALYVRDSSSTEGEIIGVLNMGDKVTCLATENNWYKVKIDAGYGWCSGKYLSFE